MYFSEDRGKEPGETCGVLKASSQKTYMSLTRTRQRPNLMAGCEEKYQSPQCVIFKLPLQSLLHSFATQFSVPGTYINSFNGLPCPLGYWREVSVFSPLATSLCCHLQFSLFSNLRPLPLSRAFFFIGFPLSRFSFLLPALLHLHQVSNSSSMFLTLSFQTIKTIFHCVFVNSPFVNNNTWIYPKLGTPSVFHENTEKAINISEQQSSLLRCPLMTQWLEQKRSFVGETSPIFNHNILETILQEQRIYLPNN